MKKWIISLMAAFCLPVAAVENTQAAENTENWPDRPLHWLVGFAPGGSADVLTRIAADKLSQQLGQPVVVENKPGASGSIALKLAAQAQSKQPYLITVPGPIIYPQPEPQIGKELQPVILLAEGPMVIVGSNKNKETSLVEVLAEAKRQPEQWSYATSGIGTSQHLAGELLNSMAQTQMLQVPYKGGGQAVADVVGSQLPLGVLGPTPVLAHIKSGALHAYAVTTKQRLAILPDVPTVEEAGLQGYEAKQWFAAAISPGVEPQHVAKLNRLLADIVQDPDFVRASEAAGMVVGAGSPEDLEAFVLADTEKWTELSQRVGLQVD